MQKDISGLFMEKWSEVYKQLLCRKEGEGEWTFGERQKIEVRQIGKYTAVRNVTLGEKRASKYVVKAFQEKKIFFPFDSSQFSFNKVQEHQTIAYVDLQKQTLSFNLNQPSDQKIIINGAPLFPGSSLYLPQIKENLPQRLNKEIIFKFLLIRKIIPSLKAVFNSQGGSSSVNHLHIQLFDPTTIKKDLISIDKVPCNLHKVIGKQLNVISFEMFGALFFQLKSAQLQIFHEQMIDLQTSILTSLVELSEQRNVPFNILITDDHTVYFIFRNFASPDVPFGYVEYCGMILCRNEKEFTLIEQDEIDKKFEEIKLPKDLICLLQEKVGVILSDFKT